MIIKSLRSLTPYNNIISKYCFHYTMECLIIFVKYVYAIILGQQATAKTLEARLNPIEMKK